MEKLSKFKLFLGQDRGQNASTLITNLKMVRKIYLSCSPLTPDTFRLYIQSLIDNRLSPSYIKKQVCIIRLWGICFNIPEFTNYKYPKVSYKSDFVRATFEDKEIHDFLNAPNPHQKGVYAQRYDMWIVFYALLFYHGFRTIEVSKLRKEYIDFGQDIIQIPASISKTNLTREVPISQAVRGQIKDYVLSLPEDQEYLFPPFHKGVGEHVQGNDWRGFFNKQVKRLGIKRKNLTPYSGRHSYGTRAGDQDVSLKKIQLIMGHAKIETTALYIHPSLQALRKVFENDRLIRSTLSYAKRFLLFRSAHRELIESYCNSPQEERRMIKDLYGY